MDEKIEDIFICILLTLPPSIQHVFIEKCEEIYKWLTRYRLVQTRREVVLKHRKFYMTQLLFESV